MKPCQLRLAAGLIDTFVSLNRTNIGLSRFALPYVIDIYYYE
jgi:hypothetical protein